MQDLSQVRQPVPRGCGVDGRANGAVDDSEDVNDPETPVTVFKFGKYKCKSVEQAKQTCASYWVFQNQKDLFPKYKWLQPALLEAEVLGCRGGTTLHG